MNRVGWPIVVVLSLLSATVVHGQGVRVETKEDRYTLESETLGGVVATLNESRLEGSRARLSQGLTRYDIRPRWRAVAGEGKCAVSALSVDVSIQITLPSWPAASARPPAERRRWEAIEEAIRRHEYVHRDLTIEAAHDLHDSLRGREARGCGTLRTVVSTELTLADGRLREAHARFDREAPKTLSLEPGR